MTEAFVFVGFVLVVAIQAAAYYSLSAQIRAIPKPKVGRPPGSRNRSKPSLVEQAQNYFGPAEEPVKSVDPEELAALIRYVNEGRIADEDQMIDPNDEFRTSTGYAGT